MEKQVDELVSEQVRNYLLQQGQGIGFLNELLQSKTEKPEINNYISIIGEIALYFLTMAIIALAIYIPAEIVTNVPLGRNFGFDIAFKNEEIQQLLFWLKVTLIIVSLPILGFALLIRRSRKNRSIIHQSFVKTEWMKLAFYKALTDFNLQNKN